jgi:Tol biopolymer transport system component
MRTFPIAVVATASLVAYAGAPTAPAAPKATPASAPATTAPSSSAPPPAASATPPLTTTRDPHAAGHHGGAAPVDDRAIIRPDEKHLKNVRQLTFGGENAEAYLDASGRELIFQTKRDGAACDAIFRMSVDGKNQRQVSPRLGAGGGRTTCSYILPDNRIVYSSTHGHGPGCLDEPDRSQGYVWKIYPEFDVWTADADGAHPKVLFQSDGYDAEATVCHKDGRIVFTSTKSGDLELWTMNVDGSGARQLTNTPGYDGGAFFSEDCTKIVWRASRPTGEKLADYQRLLKQSLVRPTSLEIFVADLGADGNLGNVVQVTNNGRANFAPYLHPDNKRVLYVSNKGDPKGRDFDIYVVNVDGTREERVTTNPSFDGFPMFSADGRTLVFASNRAGAAPGDTNVFVADWVD